MIAHNINGTSSPRFKKCKCKCGPKGGSCKNWTEFYYKHGGHRNASRCAAKGCNGDLDVGGHVQIQGMVSVWFIIPLCKGHNGGKYGSKFEIKDITPVPVQSIHY